MNETKPLTDAELEKGDEEAVMQRFLHGTPLDPGVSARVHARAAEITERDTYLRSTERDPLRYAARTRYAPGSLVPSLASGPAATMASRYASAGGTDSLVRYCRRG